MKRTGTLPFLAAAALAGGPGRAAEAPAIDLLLVNGRVYTVDAARPWAEAVAVSGERIVAVGTTADLRQLGGPEDAGASTSAAVREPRLQRRSRSRGSDGRPPDRREPSRRPRAGGVRERIQGAAERLPKGSWITRGNWGAYEQWAAGSGGAGGFFAERPPGRSCPTARSSTRSPPTIRCS